MNYGLRILGDTRHRASTGIVMSLTMSFSNSQILGLNTTPILVLPEPGEGLVYELLWAAWEFVYGSTPYSVSGGGGESAPVLFFGVGQPIIPDNLVFDAGITANEVIVNGNTANLIWESESAPSNPWPSLGTVNTAMYLGDEGGYTTISGGTGSVLNMTLLYRIVEAQ